jgi:hypothetical protein
MEEVTKGVIMIEDFSYEAVFEMVRFLYSGSCNLTPVSLPLLISLLMPDRRSRSSSSGWG